MNIFFTSDTHFFHTNILHFRDDAGKLIRAFPDVATMNELMIDGWNSVVRDGDRIYHLGDVTFSYKPEFDTLMSRLRGSKRLLLGNHDILKGTNLAKHFKKVSLWRQFKEEGFVCSHIPLHPEHFRHGDVNVHGHLHQNVVKAHSLVGGDKRYLNVCVERTNYAPISMDEVKERIAA